MSTKKTTAAKATVKTAAKAPVKKPAAPAKATKTPAKEAPKAAPAKAPVAEDILATLFKGLPANPEACTVEQVKLLQSRYSPIKDTLSDEIKMKVREYGTAATKAAAAKAASDKPSDKEIEGLVKEMNDVMDLEPVIEFGAEDTMDRIRAEAKDLRPADFDSTSPKCFTVYARATFRKLGIALPGDKAAAKAAKAATAKAPKVPGEKRATGAGRSQFGHMLTSQAGLIDAALVKGATMEDLIAVSGAATNRVAAHMAHLKSAHAVVIDKSDKGVYKLTA